MVYFCNSWSYIRIQEVPESLLAIKSTKSFRSSCKIVAKNVFLNFEVTKVFILKINKKSLLHSRSPYIQKNYCSAVVFWGVFNKDEVRYKKNRDILTFCLVTKSFEVVIVYVLNF